MPIKVVRIHVGQSIFLIMHTFYRSHWRHSCRVIDLRQVIRVQSSRLQKSRCIPTLAQTTESLGFTILLKSRPCRHCVFVSPGLRRVFTGIPITPGAVRDLLVSDTSCFVRLLSPVLSDTEIYNQDQHHQNNQQIFW